jgi:CRISPR/Cas system-associated exonuclease Cas4 (RecB family)
MIGFLNQVGSHLFKIHKDNIHKLTLVFPNRRGGTFFSHYLNSLVVAPILAPEIVTINELFTKLSPVHVPDRLSLVFRLYRTYQKLTKTKESFDDFYFWGDMLVSDFDQVDKYLVDANELFTNITELKEIDDRFSILSDEEKERLENFWKTLSNKDKSNTQEEFLRLWEDLLGVYTEFKSSLLHEGLAFEGMVYREVVETILSKNQSLFEDKQFVFIGFNALNSCEEKLFDYLKLNKKAQFYWDFDPYYLEDTNQEAGYFLRKNMARYPQSEDLGRSESYFKSNKSIEIVSIASQLGQAQVAANVLIDNGYQALNSDDTAIVLCDEELLLPMLSSLPESQNKVNVTMGYPMKSTPIYGLIIQVVDLQRNSKIENGVHLYYYKDVNAVLNHQLMVDLDPFTCRNLTAQIKKKNLIYVSEVELQSTPLFSQLFAVPETILDLSNYFLHLLEVLLEYWQNKKEGSENTMVYCEYLYQSYLAVSKLKGILIEDGAKVFNRENFISKDSFFRFLGQYLSGLSIPFEGEPLEGLQIMGILETRTLDFKNLIILSMNDSMMPKSSSGGSFIPFNLRRVFGLPTIEEQNAMYAYYFYRLIQRAEKVTFVYDSGVSGISTGEKSRYLYQLQLESKFQIKEVNMVYNLATIENTPIVVPKDQQVITRLAKYLDGSKSLSPSAIDKYLGCSLQFYFRYIAGLCDPEEMPEEVDSKTFGTLFHDVMENFYKPFVQTIVSSDQLRSLIADQESLKAIVKSSFNRVYFKTDIAVESNLYSGQNYLVFEVVMKYMNQILAFDLKRAPFRVLGVEEEVYTTVEINEGEQRVKIGGLIDRLDQIGSEVQIFDYKTGSDQLSFTMLKDLFDPTLVKRNKAAFQILLYAYVVHLNHPEMEKIAPNIYLIRELFKHDFNSSLRYKENGNLPIDFVPMTSAFETYLIELLEEIFNPKIPFQQTSVVEHCKYCSYKTICRR